MEFSIQNSIYAGTTNTFGIEIHKTGTQLMYESLYGIAGVVIQPAGLNGVTMTPLNSSVINSMSRIMDYVV